MVNIGGPSKGCLTCIKRKIRCDRRQPTCQQCEKANRHCGGYRDALDYMFRDQSEEVVAKARTESRVPSRRTKKKITPSQSAAPSENNSSSDESASSTMTRSPKLDKENGLIDFLANNFTCGESAELRSNLFWVPPSFANLLSKNESARLSVQCAGAMALARLHRSPDYLREAQKRYSAAVLDLATSLRELQMDHDQPPDGQAGDGPFIAVLFLSFFEVLASFDSSSRQAWTTHLRGLAGLLEKHRQARMHTEFGARMFRQTRSQVTLNALQTRSPLPGAFLNLSQRDRQSIPPRFKQADDADLMLMRLADTQARFYESRSPGILLPELLALDVDLLQWTQSVPPLWTYSRQPRMVHTGLWWDARNDVYSSAITAHVWNKVRAARIVIHGLVERILLHSPALAKGSARSATASEIRELITDICATIPLYYRPGGANADIGEVYTPPLLGTTFWLLWPLQVIGSTTSAPLELRDWIVLCLERIHEITGVVKAQVVADKLKASRTAPSG